MYRKKLMRVCLTGVMVVSIATANRCTSVCSRASGKGGDGER